MIAEVALIVWACLAAISAVADMTLAFRALSGRVNGLWEIRLGGLGFSGLAAISFPG